MFSHREHFRYLSTLPKHLPPQRVHSHGGRRWLRRSTGRSTANSAFIATCACLADATSAIARASALSSSNTWCTCNQTGLHASVTAGCGQLNWSGVEWYWGGVQGRAVQRSATQCNAVQWNGVMLECNAVNHSGVRPVIVEWNGVDYSGSGLQSW